MTQSLGDVAAALRQAATAVSQAVPRLDAGDPGPQDFGAGAPGRLGALGGRLHDLWRGALDARREEAASMIGRLDEAAASVVRTGQRYLDAEHAVRAAWLDRT